MKNFLFNCGTRDGIASLGILVLRLCAGGMLLIGYGSQKILHFQELKNDWLIPDLWPFSHLSPPLSLVGTILGEAIASALLILGLATRPAAFVIGFVMVVASFQARVADPFFGDGRELATHYLIAALVLIITGGGAYSLDAVISGSGKRRLFS